MNLEKDYILCDAIIFDLDGTLVDSTECVERAWKSWSEEHGVDFDKVMSISHGRQSLSTMKELLPEKANEEMARKFLQQEIDEADTVKTIKGSNEFICSIPENLWAIATSCCNKLAEARIVGSGLTIPKFIITADLVKRGKPDPESFLKAAQLLNVPIENCVIFEDSIMGVKAAISSGAKVVGMTTVFDKEKLDGIEFAIKDFTELKLEINKNQKKKCIKITKMN